MLGDLRAVASLLVCFLLLNATAFVEAAERPPRRSRLLQEDQSREKCASLLTESVPTSWVKRQIFQDRAIDMQTRRLRDAVQSQSFPSVATNRQLVSAHNSNYTVELASGPITNQHASGRCWIFAGMNMIRSELIAKKAIPESFELSQSYLHFFSLLEQSNRHLEDVIRTTYRRAGDRPLSLRRLRRKLSPSVEDGGFYEYFTFLVAKYGLVPQQAMPETASSTHTEALLAELAEYLARVTDEIVFDAATKTPAASTDARIPVQGLNKTELRTHVKRLRLIKERGLRGVWKILATHLGSPPVRFEYRADGAPKTHGFVTKTRAAIRTYTPLEFARGFVHFRPNDYVSVASYPMRRINEVYEVKDSAVGVRRERPKHNLRFLNVSIERLEEITTLAIDGGQPVPFGADIRRDRDDETGIMHPRIYEREGIYALKTDEQMLELDRLRHSFYRVTAANHAMLFTGYDRPRSGGPVVKFKTENSWGDSVGHGGVFHLYREWFERNVFDVMVHKRFLSKDERKLWQGPATMIDETHEDVY